MSDLDPKHIEAVAEEVNGLTIGSGYYQARVGMDEAREAAEAILTSTDPAVHVALLAALVRAGVLEEYIEEKPFLKPRPQQRSVYFTRWEDVDA